MIRAMALMTLMLSSRMARNRAEDVVVVDGGDDVNAGATMPAIFAHVTTLVVAHVVFAHDDDCAHGDYHCL